MRKYGSYHVPEDPTRCVEEVFSHYKSLHQCTRKRGHGPGGWYCRQHAKSIIILPKSYERERSGP